MGYNLNQDVSERLADYYTNGEGVGKTLTSEELRRRMNVDNRGTITRGIRQLRAWGFLVDMSRQDGQVYYSIEWPRTERRHWRTVRADLQKTLDNAR